MRRKDFTELNAWLPQYKAPIHAELERYVRALAAQRRGGPLESWASAVLTRRGGRSYLFTAKHVIDRLESRELFLELPGRFMTVAVASSVFDAESDAAIVPLPAESLEWGVPFVDLDVKEDPPADEDVRIFVATGFPLRRTDTDQVSAEMGFEPQHYWTFECEDAYRRHRGLRDRYIAIKFSRRRSFQGGRIREMTNSEGISGAALWRFVSSGTEMPSLMRYSLVGVLSEHFESTLQFITAGRVDVYRRLIDESAVNGSRAIAR